MESERSCYRVTIHQPSQVHHTVHLGHGTCVWPYATILEGAQLGEDCTVGSCCFIGRHARLGAGCRLHQGAAIPDDVLIGNRVYIGSHVTLINVKYPNLREKIQEVFDPPVIEDDVVIGANAVILPGVILRQGAIIGAGSVVTRDVALGCVVAGNPAKVLRRSSHFSPLIFARITTRSALMPAFAQALDRAIGQLTAEFTAKARDGFDLKDVFAFFLSCTEELAAIGKRYLDTPDAEKRQLVLSSLRQIYKRNNPDLAFLPQPFEAWVEDLLLTYALPAIYDFVAGRLEEHRAEE